ncbi:four helix bundle protein [Marinilabilia sp.]|uniref:four helix bundle protein n=1 Tax=Marinilabilia sp. TaxID=2021252 RepID=UPI0025BF973D|nr:four helix bundle protein [Marinilabilia sp.]
MYDSFQDMPVWKNSNSNAVDVFQVSSKFPRSEDYGLTSQIRRASNSVSGNIAEAFGRRTKKDKANFYVFARGSAFETQSHLLYGRDVGYIDSEKTDELLDKYNKLIFEINKIISALR